MLGDSFPQKLKEQSAERIAREPKSVSFFHQINTTPPKPKYFIIIASFGHEAAIVYINTPKKAPNAYLQSFQIPIACKKYQWLTHDSEIDCTRITEKPCKEIAEHLSRSMDAYFKGVIDDSLYEQIVNNLKRSKLVSQHLRTKYGLL